MKLLNKALTEPRHLVQPKSWVGHIPFASWLVAVLRPKLLVELGTYTGNSYLSFCQAVEQEQTGTRCYAVDTWKGDKHGGFYGEGIFELIRAAHDACYTDFSSLLRMTFDEALDRFEDGSIDLLHIDGLHTYEAVKHDFETWLPKLSDRAVVLFHDSAVFQEDFGVHRFWNEISADYPHFSFSHCNGLGVLLVGEKRNGTLLELCEQNGTPSPELAEAREIFRHLGGRFEQRIDQETVIEQQKAEIRNLSGRLQDNQQKTGKLQEKNDKLQEKIGQLKKQAADAESHVTLLQQQLRQAQHNGKELERQYQKYKKRWAVQLVKPLIQLERGISSANRYRKQFRFLVKEKGSIGKAYQTCRRTYKSSGMPAVKFLLKQIRSDSSLIEKQSRLLTAQNGFVILTPPHTHYIAKLLQQALEKAGIASEIIFNAPKNGFSDDWHIVICPQIFNVLPEHYLAFQMEQSVSSRWFNEDYFKQLNRAEYIFDYSITNIEFLQKNQIPFKKLYYLPVGLLASEQPVPQQEYEYDVAFYGDPNCERRQRFLNKLSEKFSVKIISEVFGDELRALLRKARIVVNIHYYENALLETTRIYECLSENKLVVSETGSDQAEHGDLENLVDFVNIDDADAMIERISHWLDNPQQFEERLQTIKARHTMPDKFQFYLYRFLLAQDLIDFDTFYSLCAEYIRPEGDFWCLSLSESVSRRRNFNLDNDYGIWVFPGLRHNIGWVGCGLSYKFMMKVAEDLNLPQVTICEDDVLFNGQFPERYRNIKNALTEHQAEWDVFSGLTADLSESAEILKSSIQSPDEKFYGINRLVSTVCNIYNATSYKKISSWDDKIRTTDNTIDRYIEHHGGIRGTIVSPFLVGHKEEQLSVLWGFQNTQYRELIAKSQQLLDEKISQLETNQET